ncbi:MAG: adenosine kinase, partial [Lentisphaeria bacterium]|nr:adenosine kinase [Lentisphaeria bacterium]
VVRRFRSEVEALLPYLDLIFANEDEAREFLRLPPEARLDPEQAAVEIARSVGSAVVKGGAGGAWIRRRDTVVHVDALPTAAVDTTGAGDFWQAGFLYGILRGRPAETAGKMGALLAARVVAVLGAELPERTWNDLRRTVAALERP